MYVRNRYPILRALRWTAPVFLWTGPWATALAACHALLGWTWMEIPALPVTIMGTAVSFYLGFKGNAGYDRLWEARKIWGGIVNSSRTWGIQVTSLVSDLHRDAPFATPLDTVHRELIYRHVAWLGALRTQLRRRKSWEHQSPADDRIREAFDTADNSNSRLETRISALLGPDELSWVLDRKNPATQLLAVQSRRLKELFAEGRIEDFRHMMMVKLIEELYTLQGKCERIKNFPLPRQYASVNHWFVKFFIVVLPLALLGPFQALGPHRVWMTIPVSMALSWMFYIWDRILDFSENPFEGMVNDVPIDALSRTIEIDLREMLGETDLPTPLLPKDNILL